MFVFNARKCGFFAQKRGSVIECLNRWLRFDTGRIKPLHRLHRPKGCLRGKKGHRLPLQRYTACRTNKANEELCLMKEWPWKNRHDEKQNYSEVIRMTKRKITQKLYAWRKARSCNRNNYCRRNWMLSSGGSPRSCYGSYYRRRSWTLTAEVLRRGSLPVAE